MDQTGGGTRGRKPPFWAIKHPARPYKSAVEILRRFIVDIVDLLWKTLRVLKRPGRARTVQRGGALVARRAVAAPAPLAVLREAEARPQLFAEGGLEQFRPGLGSSKPF